MIEWRTSAGLTAYPDAVAWMEERVDAIQVQQANECIWCVEHPPLYTAGVSSKEQDLLSPEQLPIFTTNRGGQITYHGPGQRVVYLLLDLKKQMMPEAPDLHRYVALLEQWVIATLARFGVQGHIRPGRIGVWVETDKGEAKIAAIGIRVRKWISYHGIAINLSPNLSHFDGIIPCGIREYGVTSLAALGIHVSLAELDAALEAEFVRIFGRNINHGTCAPSSPS